ncbi:TPA: hypothetical protein N0F65_010003 [Lagenidium giganteum]|uniref:MARVEL domain-containing protein n=1 Tax=Lagenidium giganteum TaxID=4803 RepID=A0AAV2ZHD6_9STRA|nr:TPA: hypothetical protein N0F65_010003 [Lagenidium giganteum]
MVDPRVPLWVRSGTLIPAFIAIASGSAGYIRTCRFGADINGSRSQINFMIAMGVLSFIVLIVRIVVFDVRQWLRDSRKLFLAIDALFMFLTFVAAVAGSVAPVSSAVCSKEDNKAFMENVCHFKCANIMAAIVSNFCMFLGFMLSLLFTFNPSWITSAAEEESPYKETPPTPRSDKPTDANLTKV